MYCIFIENVTKQTFQYTRQEEIIMITKSTADIEEQTRHDFIFTIVGFLKKSMPVR